MIPEQQYRDLSLKELEQRLNQQPTGEEYDQLVQELARRMSGDDPEPAPQSAPKSTPEPESGASSTGSSGSHQSQPAADAGQAVRDAINSGAGYVSEWIQNARSDDNDKQQEQQTAQQDEEDEQTRNRKRLRNALIVFFFILAALAGLAESLSDGSLDGAPFDSGNEGNNSISVDRVCYPNNFNLPPCDTPDNAPVGVECWCTFPDGSRAYGVVGEAP